MKSNKDIGFIADFFRSDILGGAESNNAVLISYLESKGYIVEKIKSTTAKLKKGGFYIVANFIGLSEQNKKFLQDNCTYIISEHDFKYLKSRNPSNYINFIAPKEEIVNEEFYRTAKEVVVLSAICKDIIECTLGLCNVRSIGTSLWSDAKFEYLEKALENKKVHDYAIVDSSNTIKGRAQSIKWCKDNGKDFKLISSSNEQEFLEQLSRTKKLVFMPQVLETFSRLAAEAKMLECKLVTKKSLLGFASEACYDVSGLALQREMKMRVHIALRTFEELIIGSKK